MECKCETCVKKDCPDRTKQDSLRIVIACVDYTEHKPTNADRIRAMTDEELAHELALIAGWDREQYKKAKSIGIEKVMMDWLKQPAEEA